MKIKYTIKTITPFAVLSTEEQSFAPFEYLIVDNRVYIINWQEIKDIELKKRLYTQLLDFINNTNAHNKDNILNQYTRTLRDYLKNKGLYTKFQSVEIEYLLANQADISQDIVTFNKIYDANSKTYRFYIPGSSIKGLFRSILIQSSILWQDKINCLFGERYYNNINRLPNSTLIFRDLFIQPKNIKIYKIVRKDTPLKKGTKNRGGAPNIITAIKPNVELTGHIYVKPKNCTQYNTSSLNYVQELINQWPKIANTIFNNIYSNQSYKAYPDNADWTIPNLDIIYAKDPNAVIFQTGFGSTNLFKKYKGKLPGTQWQVKSSQEPLGFIKISINLEND